MRTFVDTGVLLAAFQGNSPCHAAAMAVLDDPQRELLFSDLVRLETLPKARFHNQQDELAYYEAIFAAATTVLSTSPQLIEKALDIASNFGLKAIDACLATSAIELNADEFVTTEKSTKPYFRIQGTTTRFVSLAPAQLE